LAVDEEVGGQRGGKVMESDKKSNREPIDRVKVEEK
jgi:hypothetical protein